MEFHAADTEQETTIRRRYLNECHGIGHSRLKRGLCLGIETEDIKPGKITTSRRNLALVVHDLHFTAKQTCRQFLQLLVGYGTQIFTHSDPFRPQSYGFISIIPREFTKISPSAINSSTSASIF